MTEGFHLDEPVWRPPTRFEDRSESLRAAAGYFKAGEANLELAEAHAWGDTVLLVMIERQHGKVGCLPDQDWCSAVPEQWCPHVCRLAIRT